MKMLKKVSALILLLLSINSYSTTYSYNPLETEVSEDLKHTLDSVVAILADKKNKLGEKKYQEFINGLKIKIGYLYFELKNMSGDDIGGTNSTGVIGQNGDDLDVIMEAIKKAVFTEVSGVTTDSNIDSIMELIKESVFSDNAIESYTKTNLNKYSSSNTGQYKNTYSNTNLNKNLNTKTNQNTNTLDSYNKSSNNSSTNNDINKPIECKKNYGTVCYKNENVVWASNTCNNKPGGSSWIDRGQVRGKYVWLKRLRTSCK